MLDWLYGPRYLMDTHQRGAATLRNLTMDVETLFDLSVEMPGIVDRSGLMMAQFMEQDELQFSDGDVERIGPPALIYTSETRYQLRGRDVSEDDLRNLGTSDRGQIVMTVDIRAAEMTSPTEGKAPISAGISAIVSSAHAHVRFTDPSKPQIEPTISDIADYLHRNSSCRPYWRGTRWLAWLAPIPVALGAWLWAALTNDWPFSLHVLIFAVLILSSSGVVARAFAARKRSRTETIGKSFRYRGESRKDTQQRRADTAANVKVFLITAPVSLIVGLIVGALTEK